VDLSCPQTKVRRMFLFAGETSTAFQTMQSLFPLEEARDFAVCLVEICDTAEGFSFVRHPRP